MLFCTVKVAAVLLSISYALRRSYYIPRGKGLKFLRNGVFYGVKIGIDKAVSNV